MTIEALAEQKVPAILKNFIGGAWVASTSSEKLVVPNPATEQPLAYVPLSNAADVAAAVAALATVDLPYKLNIVIAVLVAINAAIC